MENQCRPSSFFGDLRSRELNGFRGSPSRNLFHFLNYRSLILPYVVRKRPHLGELTSDANGPGTGVLAIEHDGSPSPPTAISFCKVESLLTSFTLREHVSCIALKLFDLR